MKNHVPFSVMAVFFMCLTITAQTKAATLTTNMPISVQISSACSLSAIGINFGNYTAGPNAPALSSTGTVSVTCPSGLPYKVGLDVGTAGQNGVLTQDGPVSFRALNVSGAPVLSYQLYQDAARTTVWGDHDMANTSTIGSSQSGTGTGANQTLTVYGFVEGGQAVNTSTTSATDTIKVTLLF